MIGRSTPENERTSATSAIYHILWDRPFKWGGGGGRSTGRVHSHTHNPYICGRVRVKPGRPEPEVLRNRCDPCFQVPAKFLGQGMKFKVKKPRENKVVNRLVRHKNVFCFLSCTEDSIWKAFNEDGRTSFNGKQKGDEFWSRNFHVLMVLSKSGPTQSIMLAFWHWLFRDWIELCSVKLGSRQQRRLTIPRRGTKRVKRERE